MAVAVSDVTGEVLTAASKERGVSHDVLRFEYDDVLGFSADDERVFLGCLHLPSTARCAASVRIRRA